MPEHIGSFALIANTRDQLLFLLRDDNPQISAPNKWGLIGGGVEGEETPIQTVLREVQEESNLLLDPNQLIFVTKRPSDHDPIKLSYLYFVRISEKQEKTIKLGNEGQKLAFFSMDEIDNLDTTPGIKKHFPLLREQITQLLMN